MVSDTLHSNSRTSSSDHAVLFFLGYTSAGFLAFLATDLTGRTSSDLFDYITFDTEVYDDGDNYDPSTGIYTVPHDGFYLIHVRVYGKASNFANHYIMVDGVKKTYTRKNDPDTEAAYQAGSTSITLHLLAGQEVAVDPYIDGTVAGAGYMATTFGATLIYFG